LLRKIVWGGLAFVLLAGLLFCVWLRMYKVTDPARATEIRKNAVAAVKARDQLGENAATNGYSDLQYILQRESKPDEMAPYRALTDFSYAASATTKKDMLTAWTDRHDEAVKAAAQFETVMPKIQTAFGKPNFIWPSNWKLGPKAPVPNFIMMRALVQNLMGYAEYLELKGQPDQALAIYLSSLEYAAKVSQNGPLVGGMIGCAIDAIAATNATEFLGRSPALSAAGYRGAIARLEKLPMTASTLLARLDEEYAYDLHTIDLLRHNMKMLSDDGKADTRADVMAALMNYSGYLTHEQKVIENIYLRQRPSYEKLHTPDADGFTFQETLKILDQNLSVIAKILLPNASRAVTQWRMVLTRNKALEILCALQLYKLEKKQYPATLEALVPDYLPKVPTDDISPDQKFSYQAAGDTMSLSTALIPAANFFGDGKTLKFYPPEPRKTI
jgi:hypothetical protein